MNRKMSRSSEGFTLIELLVVVLIIGVLASIAIPQYFKVVERSRFAEVQDAAGAVVAAQERLFARTSTYTANFGALDVTLKNNLGVDISAAGPAPLRNYTINMALVGTTGFTITFTRTGSVPGRYGLYTVVYTCGQGAPCTPVCTAAPGTGGTAAVTSDIL